MDHRICNFLKEGGVSLISLVTDLASFTIWVCVSQNQLYVTRNPFLEKKSTKVGNLKQVL